MEKKDVAQKFLAKLQGYTKSAEFANFEADNPVVAAQIKNMTTDKLIIGDCPRFIEGHFEGNVTGKGHCHSSDIRYEKTFCSDFNTGYFVFIADGGLSDKALCDEALKLTDWGYPQAFKQSEKGTLVQNETNAIVKSELRKLDFWFDSARLNSWKFVQDNEETTLPFYPVYADLSDGNGGVLRTVIGIYSLIGDKEIIKTDLHTRILSQPINGRTSAKAKAAAAKAAKKRKVAISLAVIFSVLAIVGTVLGTLLPSLL